MFRHFLTRRDGAVWASIGVAIWFLAAARCIALDPGKAITQYVQSSWTTESGLPQNSVHAIAQSEDGYLWMGTEEGLSRFDGIAFSTYNHATSPTLPSDYILALAAGRNGDLWIGTDSGLAELRLSSKGSNATFRTITKTDGLSSNYVTSLCLTSDGVLWVGTAHGLNRVSQRSVQPWLTSGPLATASVTALVTTPGGSVWVGTTDGVFQIRDDRVTRFAGHLPASDISSLATTADGSLWVGSLGGGLARIHDGRVFIPQQTFAGKDIDALLVDHDGALWIAFDRHGIGRLYEGKFTGYSSAQGLPSDRSTRALFEDREGNLWFGLLDAGLVQLRDGKFAVFGKREGLAGNYVGNVLQASDGSMWIGSDSNGLNHLLPDGRVEIWNDRNGLPKDAVYSLLQTRDGSLWVGYRSGKLARIRNGEVSIYTDHAARNVSLNALFEDRNGQIWLGFWGKGLARFKNGRFEHLGGTERVSGIAQSRDGALWFAFDGDGLERLFHGVATRYTTDNGLPSNHVMCVYADVSDTVWAGTASGGITRIRANQTVSWTAKDGLIESTVGSIIADDSGNLWFGGDHGIYRIAIAELDRSAASHSAPIKPQQFGTVDGLRSHETLYGAMPCVWKARNGKIWFGTIRGAAVVDPARILKDIIIPPTWIEKVLFNSSPIPIEQGGRVRQGAGNLEVAFTGLSFVAPEHLRFRYRLFGFDPVWIEAGGRRNAWYTNLPPGRYRFEVEAENSDGIRNRKGDSFSCIVVPPAWRSPLAYISYAVLAILLGWCAVRLRTRTLIRRQEELRRTVAERTAQLQNEKAALEVVRRELQIQATHDHLTGTFNRAAILEHLEREICRAAREKSYLGVIVADLDYFKSINDSYGHHCGDQVIQQCAARFQGELRGYDLLGRFGGEEFLILLPGWDPITCPERTAAFMAAISDRPFITDAAELQLTCSLGAAAFHPREQPPTPLEIVKRADAALYVAKNSGRNCARFEERVGDKAEMPIS